MGRESEESIATTIDAPPSRDPKDPRVCPRCGGWTETTYYMDQYDLTCLWAVGRRCLNCGEIMDAVTIANKQRNVSIGLKRTRQRRLPMQIGLMPEQGR